MTTPSPEAAQTPAPVPGTPEHDAALVATFEAAQRPPERPASEPAPKPERPASVPEKFWDAEKGEVKWDAIAALDKPTDTPPAETGEKKPDEADKSEAVTAFEKGTADGTEALKAVGLDYAKYAESWRTNGGKLTDADYAEMEAKNIPRAVVDAHVAGLQAHADAEVATLRNGIFSVVGGEANYKALVTWAQANVPVADIAAFDKVIDSGSVDAVKLAVQGLQSRKTEAEGQDPNLLGGGRSAVLDVYESTYQLTQDMKDPRYDKDPAFRAQVQRKLSRSNIM